jgi:hypothetical protein
MLIFGINTKHENSLVFFSNIFKSWRLNMAAILWIQQALYGTEIIV